jgi:hypothetical protein
VDPAKKAEDSEKEAGTSQVYTHALSYWPSRLHLFKTSASSTICTGFAM